MDVFKKLMELNNECRDVYIALDGVRLLAGIEDEAGCALSVQMMLDMLQKKLVHATDGIDDIIKVCQSAGGDAK